MKNELNKPGPKDAGRVTMANPHVSPAMKARIALYCQETGQSCQEFYRAAFEAQLSLNENHGLSEAEK